MSQTEKYERTKKHHIFYRARCVSGCHSRVMEACSAHPHFYNYQASLHKQATDNNPEPALPL